MERRTHLEFPAPPDFDHELEAWSRAFKFVHKRKEGDTDIYQKGVGFWVAPMMLSVRRAGGNVHLEAWIRVNTFIRAMSLFLVPSEMGIQSGGFRLAAPRSIARKAVNEMLLQLGQDPIP